MYTNITIPIFVLSSEVWVMIAEVLFFFLFFFESGCDILSLIKWSEHPTFGHDEMALKSRRWGRQNRCGGIDLCFCTSLRPIFFRGGGGDQSEVHWGGIFSFFFHGDVTRLNFRAKKER